MMLKNPTDAILQMFSFMLHPPHRPRTFKLHYTPVSSIDLFGMLAILLVTVHYISVSTIGAGDFIIVGPSGEFGEGEFIFDALAVGG